MAHAHYKKRYACEMSSREVLRSSNQLILFESLDALGAKAHFNFIDSCNLQVGLKSSVGCLGSFLPTLTSHSASVLLRVACHNPFSTNFTKVCHIWMRCIIIDYSS